MCAVFGSTRDKRSDCDDLPAANLQRNDQFWNCAIYYHYYYLLLLKWPIPVCTSKK